jgi:REG-2-like HAD superfamily hydrolase
MKPKVVTFDCASTLVDVRWTPGRFAVDCARAVGFEVNDEDRRIYERSLRTRWPEYEAVNQTRDPAVGDAFWLRLTEDWLSEIGRSIELAVPMCEAAPSILYGEGSDVFELYEDVLPTLAALDDMGIRIGVISNWDYSLHRVLRSLDVHHRFEQVVASLEEGVEKPDARLFQLTLQRFEVSAGEAVHVGDNPLDDLEGAQGVGMAAFLIDRSAMESTGDVLSQLTDLVDRLSAC